MISRALIPLMMASLALSTPASAAAQARAEHVEPGASRSKTWVLNSERELRPLPSNAISTSAERAEQGGRAEEPVVRPARTVTAVEQAKGLATQPSLDLSAFEALCRAEGWGHWWDGKTCLTIEETLTRTQGQTPGPHGGW